MRFKRGWQLLGLFATLALFLWQARAQNSNLQTLTNGQVQWDIERVEARIWAGNWTPLRGMVYLTIFGTLSNSSSTKAEVFAKQVRVTVDGKTYEPHGGIMDRLQDNLNGMDYIGEYQGISVLPGERRSIFVAFEVPAQWRTLELSLDNQSIALSSLPVSLAVPTSTSTPTPTSTPTATFTPLPSATPGGLPFIDNGQIRWVISRVERRSKAGNWKPLVGMTYLTIFGSVSNVGSVENRLLSSQIRLRVDGKDY